MKFFKYWYKLTFQALQDISNLPLYSGIHWSAFFRNELRQFTKKSSSELDFCVIPRLNTDCAYRSKSEIIIHLATNEEGKSCLEKWFELIEDESYVGNTKGHFIFNKTISLKEFSGFEYEPSLDFDFSYNEKTLTILFPTPLRIKRRDQSKGKYADTFNFNPLHFFEQLANAVDFPLPDLSSLYIQEQSFIWVDIAYKKTLGGMIGGFTIRGNFSKEILQLLHFGQFTGVGKNRSFGFGFYYVDEFPHPFFDQTEPFEKHFSFTKLRIKLEEMIKKNEHGSDMTAVDLLNFPDFVRKLSNSISNNNYKPSPPLLYKIPKKKGGYRKIASYSMKDKLVLSILTDLLDKKLQSLLTKECFAYRKGYSFHLAAEAVKKEFEKGFTWGLKIDIEKFFETISFHKLNLILKILWQNDDTYKLIELFFKENLIQGNTLSPLLSNLAMLAFDSWFKRHKKIKLIRYADDMIVLSKTEEKTEVLDEIKFMLNKLGLSINPNKFEEFSQTSTISFLGYEISNSHIFMPIKTEEIQNESEWLPFDKLAEQNRKPLFLSFSVNYVQTTGNNIIIKQGESSSKIPWKEVSRIVIFGKPRISGGLIYKAMNEQVPISFLTIHGRNRGSFQTAKKLRASKKIFNESDWLSWENFKLDFVREIVYTKIINQYRLLKKNKITSQKIYEIVESLKECDSIDSLRGKEGFAAKIYFSEYRKLVEPFAFQSRSYHPPIGPINVLLSLGYTLIYRRFSEALQANDIDSFAGVFHQGRGTHEALASDFTECYRFLIDRIVIALIHRKQIKRENFYSIQNSNYMKLDSDGFRTFIRAFETTMKTEVKIKNISFTYEQWIDYTIRSFKNSLTLGTKFVSFRSL